VGKKSAILRDVTDPAARRYGIEASCIDAVDHDPAGIRINQAVEAAEKRGFS
jgi:hypothetical protein